MPEQHRNLASEYIAAVDTLTRPHMVPIPTRESGQTGERLEAPMLQILATNCAGGVSRGDGVGSEAHTRTPLNVGAADLLDAIRKAVLQDYANLVGGGARPDVTPALLQVRLYVLNRWRAGTLSNDALQARIMRLKGWAQDIRNLLDPPMRIEVTAPCPRCGARWATKRDGDEVAALTPTYRDVRDVAITCAHCGAYWGGIDGARRLRTEVDATERMRALLDAVAVA